MTLDPSSSFSDPTAGSVWRGSAGGSGKLLTAQAFAEEETAILRHNVLHVAFKTFQNPIKRRRENSENSKNLSKQCC